MGSLCSKEYYEKMSIPRYILVVFLNFKDPGKKPLHISRQKKIGYLQRIKNYAS